MKKLLYFQGRYAAKKKFKADVKIKGFKKEAKPEEDR